MKLTQDDRAYARVLAVVYGFFMLAAPIMVYCTQPFIEGPFHWSYLTILWITAKIMVACLVLNLLLFWASR